MKRVLALTLGLLLTAGTAMAAGELMTTVPPSSQTVTDWYKQSVYDPNNTRRDHGRPRCSRREDR
jgi:hypothetical protein